MCSVPKQTWEAVTGPSFTWRARTGLRSMSMMSSLSRLGQPMYLITTSEIQSA